MKAIQTQRKTSFIINKPNKARFNEPMLIGQNMSRKGSSWDNAPMECFFATLKTEGFYQAGVLSVAALTKIIGDYIRSYHHERIGLNLKKPSPVAYRTQLKQAV